MRIETTNITIRYFNRKDFRDYYEIVSDEKVSQYEFSEESNISDAEVGFLNILEHYSGNQGHSLMYLGVELNETNKIIGFLSVDYVDPEMFIVSLGFGFNSNFWGKNYAFETVEGFIKYHFDNDGIRVSCGAFAENERCIKLLQKLGFKKEGHLRSSTWAKDRIWDEVIFGLIRNDLVNQ